MSLLAISRTKAEGDSAVLDLCLSFRDKNVGRKKGRGKNEKWVGIRKWEEGRGERKGKWRAKEENGDGNE